MELQIKQTNDHKVYHKKMDLILKDNLQCLQELRKNLCKKPQIILVIFKIKKNIKYTKFNKMNKI